ncbi:MAG: PAS domain S-box protein [Steroidobacteraceae bacterium]
MSTQPGLPAIPWSVLGPAVTAAVLVLILGWTMRALRHARAASRRAARLLQLLAEGADDYALVELDASGVVMQWSTGAQRLHGYAAQEMVGKHCSRLYTEEDRAANVPQKELELAARQGRHAVSGARTGKGDRRIVTEVSIHAQRDRTGRLAGFICVEHDLTDRTGRQQALEQTRAALVQAQKLAALGRLGDGIAHDFNNVIQVISTCVQTLQRHLVGQAQATGFLQMIRRNAERAAGLSQHLLSLARREPSGAVLTNVNEVVAEVVELLRHTLSEEITLDVRVGGGLLWTVIDPNQLEAALLHLVVHARDAMPAGGTLSIETAEAMGSPGPPGVDAAIGTGTATDSATDASRTGYYVMIAVAHTGAAAVAEADASPGTEQFGPQAVRGFIEQAGGMLSSEPQGAHGTTVRLYLPRRAG